MKYATMIALFVGCIAQSNAVIINQTMAGRQLNLTKDEPKQLSESMKNETKNVTIAVNETK